MASLYQRSDSGNWWARIDQNGRDLRFSTGIDDKEQAERFLRALVPLYAECQRLGIACDPRREGLLQIAKRVEAAWIHVERLLNKLRERGFLGG